MLEGTSSCRNEKTFYLLLRRAYLKSFTYSKLENANLKMLNIRAALRRIRRLTYHTFNRNNTLFRIERSDHVISPL